MIGDTNVIADPVRVARALNGSQRSALHDCTRRIYWRSGNWWRARNGSILLNATVGLLRSRGLVEAVPDVSGRERVQATTLGTDVLAALEDLA